MGHGIVAGINDTRLLWIHSLGTQGRHRGRRGRSRLRSLLYNNINTSSQSLSLLPFSSSSHLELSSITVQTNIPNLSDNFIT